MNWWALLFEMLGLSLLGFLYYIFQKKRILRDFELDLDYVIEEILILVSEQLEVSPSEAATILEKKLDQLKIDRKTFLTEEELTNLINHNQFSPALVDALSQHKNILINKYEKK